jgi:LmbE family N-acetylglucosaminyl deacetylase
MTRAVAACFLFVTLAGAAIAVPVPPSPAQQPARKTLVAVFAHPDDEILVAPLLAAYARRGVRVHLVIVTDGEKGVSAHAKIPAGAALAKVRAEEARCSCAAMGIEAPTLLGFKDGELGQIGLPSADKAAPASPPGRHLAEVRDRIAKTVGALRPDAIITFGPEGYYGHADHRLVGALVTELVQAGAPGFPAILVYPGFPKERLAGMPDTGTEWAGTDERFLTVRVPFDATDLKAARSALACHKSQFPEAQVDPLVGFMTKLLDGRVYLRPWFGSATTDDIFAIVVR